jgi:two-component system NtrC family sensor kinase
MEVLRSSDAFDRELSLEELLSGFSLERLSLHFAGLLGDFLLSDDKGRTLVSAGKLANDAATVEIVLDIEPVGFLQANVPVEQLMGVAGIVKALLQSQKRYLMAARLHEEQVSHDYQRLQQEHAALLKSELKYRTLSQELEARVQEQVEALKIAERQLYQAEKLASVGQLAAGVAHEINNPIGFIRSNLSTASTYLKQMAALQVAFESGDAAAVNAAWKKADMDFVLEDFRALVEESIAGADRVARIVSDLKGFSSVDRATEELVDLNESVRTVCNVASNQIQRKATLKLELGELPMFLCQPGRINDVLLTMILNSIHAVGEDGVIRISTALEGNEILIAVADNGCGIPPENLTRIFDPFFTTREVGSGTGLGLTICRDIVHAHGGRIAVESRVGEGTTFTIRLPLKAD